MKLTTFIKRLPLIRLTQSTRWRRFKKIKRGYFSLIILTTLIALSFFAELLVNNRPLLMWYDGQLFFPTYSDVHLGVEFGYDYHYEVDYRQLAERFAADGSGWLLLPPLPWNPFELDIRPGRQPPYPPDISRGHLLGTDVIGRDIFARLIYGFRTAILFALIVAAAIYLIGVLLGCLMGYHGGWFDLIMQRFIEIMSLMPTLYIIMIVVSIFKPRFWIFVLIYVLFRWTGPTWYMRVMTYRERENDYVLAARTMGASTWRVIRVHILPNVLVMIITVLPFTIVGLITGLTALDYLGLGLPPPTPSWGELLRMGQENLGKPWILASVIVAVVTVLIMMTFIGEAVREAFDPRRYTQYR